MRGSRSSEPVFVGDSSLLGREMDEEPAATPCGDWQPMDTSVYFSLNTVGKPLEFFKQ